MIVSIIILLFYLLDPLQAETLGEYIPSRCSTCQNLNECAILNNYQLPDPIVGYTRDQTQWQNAQGVCIDMDKKARLFPLFGTQYQDTQTCRKLVYNFHCLTWASKANPCTLNPAPRPCRSLCMEVAEKCVYMKFFRQFVDHVCHHYECNTTCKESETMIKKSTNSCTLHETYELPGLSSATILSISMEIIIVWMTVFLAIQWH